MRKSARYNEVMSLINMLSPEEKDAVVNEIMEKFERALRTKTEECAAPRCDTLIAEFNNDKPDCPRCGAKAALGHIIKKDIRKGVQNYYCKSCKRKFRATTGTVFAGAHKDADTWRKYIQMTLSGATITMCQEECGLSRRIAFNWRHKLLHVFEENLESVQMSDTVEVDEMLIPLSFKGNHVQGKFGVRTKASGAENDMPREAYERGTDNKSRSSKDKACVFCMVENGDKAFYAAVPGVGFMDEQMLDATMAKHTDKKTVHLLADNYRVTRQYLEDNGYTHTILASNTSDNPKDHKPEIKGELHLQHVNAFHHQLRQFLAPYCGVSSKYLSHYVAMFIWLKSFRTNQKKQTKRSQAASKKAMEKASVARAAMPGCYISGSRLDSRPAVPQCA